MRKCVLTLRHTLALCATRCFATTISRTENPGKKEDDARFGNLFAASLQPFFDEDFGDIFVLRGSYSFLSFLHNGLGLLRQGCCLVGGGWDVTAPLFFDMDMLSLIVLLPNAAEHFASRRPCFQASDEMECDQVRVSGICHSAVMMTVNHSPLSQRCCSYCVLYTFAIGDFQKTTP